MTTKRLTTGLAPEVFVERVDGSLTIKGWDEPEVLVRTDSEEALNLRTEGIDVLRLSCRGDCVLRLPQSASLQIGSVMGDVHVKLLDDPLTIETVHGSLTLRNVAETRVEAVHGTLFAKHIAGDIEIDKVDGNVFLRDIQGGCRLVEVNGNLEASDIEAEVETKVNGNVRLRLRTLNGSSYSVQCDGNLHCRVSEDANLRVNMHCGANNIRVKVPGQSSVINESDTSLALGDGEIPMQLSAEGTIFFASQEVDWADRDEEDEEAGDEFTGLTEEISQQLNQQINAQVEAQMAAISRQINEQMANLSTAANRVGMSMNDTERLIQRARQSSEEATARAQERMRRAQEKIERKLAAAQRRADARARTAEHKANHSHRQGWSFEWHLPPRPPAAPRPPAPPKEGVSDEERMMVLRMLEQKKISLEEAEKLLAALENKQS